MEASECFLLNGTMVLSHDSSETARFREFGRWEARIKYEFSKEYEVKSMKTTDRR